MLTQIVTENNSVITCGSVAAAVLFVGQSQLSPLGLSETVESFSISARWTSHQCHAVLLTYRRATLATRRSVRLQLFRPVFQVDNTWPGNTSSHWDI